MELDLKEIQKSLARKRFDRFVSYTKHDYEFNWHHKLLCDKLQDFALGKIKRLMVFMPPRHGKTELASRRLPAWIFGINPNARIISTSYSAELSSSFNRDVQRIIDSKEYAEVFPDTYLNSKNVRSDANSKWIRNNDVFEIVNHKGMYRCAGVGGSITGTGGDYLIIDDPIKNYEDAKSGTMRRKVIEWYSSTLYTRQEKDAGIMIIQCMTGDTNVLMKDGTNKKLQNILVGDSIRTYENGLVSSSKIKNWKCCGLDLVYSIRTKSGITVKANERHPFLISRNGKQEWVRLKELQINDKMMRVTEHGLEKNVQLSNAKAQRSAKDFVNHITTKTNGLQDIGRHQSIKNQEEQRTLSIDTELNCTNTIKNLKIKTEFAQYVKKLLTKLIHQLIGIKNFVLITNTKLEKLEGCFATNAICYSSMEIQSKFLKAQSNTCEFIHDEIIEISKVGYENVYDIEVDRTENFIANGLVSHNTRWHEDDLSGYLIDQSKKESDFSDKWDVVSLPALSNGETALDQRKNIDEPLWENKYNYNWLMTTKNTLGSFQFSALYQQNPTPNDGSFVKLSWIKKCEIAPDHFTEIIQSWDMSFGSTSENASFVVGSVYGRIGASVYLLDQVRGQWNFSETIAQFKFMNKKHPKALRKLVERKANGQAVIDSLCLEVPGIIPVDPVGSKESRLASCQPMYEAGNIYYVEASYVDDHIDEIISFPNGKFNDRVDTESQALNYFKDEPHDKFDERYADLKSSGFENKKIEW